MAKFLLYLLVDMKGFKYRIYPETQELILCEKHFGCKRFIFNLALETKIKAYSGLKKNLSKFDLNKQIPQLKEDCIWLKEVNSQSLQQAVDNLDKAFKNFFDHRAEFPKFKSKKNEQSFCVPQNAEIDWKNNLLFLPKFKNGIPIVLHRGFKGEIKSVTISKTSSGKYFASVLVDDKAVFPTKPVPSEDTAIGIDMNIKNFCTFGNTKLNKSEEVPNPTYLKISLKLLKRRQRQHSRKQKGSKNREKARLKLARKHEKIANQRSDFSHKFSYKFTHDSQVSTICIEDLNVKGMLKNHNLARAISDVAWGEFFRQLKYKADWNGKNILECGRFDATSKTCRCGFKNNSLTLKDRVWTCPKCGSVNKRDELAFDNIISFSLKRYNDKLKKKNRDGLPELTLGEFSPLLISKRNQKVKTKNQEKFSDNMLRIAS